MSSVHELYTPELQPALIEAIADLTGDEPLDPTGVNAENTVYDEVILRNPRVCNNCFRVVREPRYELPEHVRPSLKRIYRPWYPPDRGTSERDYTGWRCDNCGTPDVNHRIWDTPSADQVADLAAQMARAATTLGYPCDPDAAAETAETAIRAAPSNSGKVDRTLRVAFEVGYYHRRLDVAALAFELDLLKQEVADLEASISDSEPEPTHE